jgi:lysophospholipase L1-like esterase
MRRRWALVAVAVLTAATPAVGAGQAAADTSPVYYPALGDSLAVGIQPKTSEPLAQGPTTGQGGAETLEGYADQLAALEGETIPNLHLVKLGCAGESTTTMIDGRTTKLPPPPPLSLLPAEHTVGLCAYQHGSQLNDAVAFLEQHRGQVAFVAIDIGAEAGQCGLDVGCLNAAFQTIQTNLATILGKLRDATGPGVPIAGMNYYNPSVVVWFQDPALAQFIVNLTVQFNDALEGSYQAAGSPVADVEAAFSMTDFTIEPDGLPLNVERVCQWTWQCTSFANVHPNKEGYGVIAQTFQSVLPMR